MHLFPFNSFLNRPFLSCLAGASAVKRVLVQNLSCEDEFDLHGNEYVGGTHHHMNGLALTQREKTTRKLPITPGFENLRQGLELGNAMTWSFWSFFHSRAKTSLR